jgi:hypothetical protein
MNGVNRDSTHDNHSIPQSAPMIRRARFVMAWSLCSLAATAQSPIEIGDHKQLFIDKRFIATSDRIELRMNPVQKLGLILDESGRPSSESGHTSRVIEDSGSIRLYIGAGDLFILESEDGLRFKRVDVRIGRGELPTIFLDKHDPDPARRYKLFWLQTQNPFNSETDGIFCRLFRRWISLYKRGSSPSVLDR